MILGALNQYYERLLARGTQGLAPPGYSTEKIGFVLMLSPQGEPVTVYENSVQIGKKTVAGTMSVPSSFKRPGTTPRPFFLWDKTSYVFGVEREGKDGVQESLKTFTAFRDFHERALAQSDDPGLLAFLYFLRKWSPERFSQPPFDNAMLDANFVFRLEGGEQQFIHERPAARALWMAMQGDGVAAGAGDCLVTGQRLPLARLHPAIKGVNGAQSAGASIVSFNLDAFASYGKEQGHNAPVSEQAAFAYTTALNFLLRRDEGNRQRMQIGDATVVFWAEADDTAQAGAAENLFAAMLAPKPDDAEETEMLRHALERVRQSHAVPDLGPGLDPGTRMYVLGLAPNASRLSIRYWIQGDLGEFARRLAQHHEDLRLEPSPWRMPPPLWRLLLAAAPTRNGKAKTEDVPPQLAGELARAVLEGRRYPQSLLNVLVMRMRADGDVGGTRVALCKAIIARNRRLQSRDSNTDPNTDDRSVPVSLDLANTDPGYVLGRLFSTLENVQRAALGDKLNATIRDRYYGGASATPASVFPVLLRNAQHHLSRLRKDKPGFAVNLEKEIGETIDLLPAEFPRSLRIEAQGHFAIGYYHQTQARFARKDGAQADDHDTQDDTTDTAGEPA
jgi:CRISPR-associated protein Csd1